jgi:hypothetical protein
MHLAEYIIHNKNKNMINIIFILSIFLVSCTNSSRENDVDSVKAISKYYKDINIYKLEGIDELNELEYPCIEIKSLNKAKIITYHTNKQIRSTQEYVRSDSFWLSRWQAKGDTSMIYSYEFVLPDKVLAYNYVNTVTYKLMDVTLISNNKEIAYEPIGDFKVSPEIQNFNMVIENSKISYINEIKEDSSTFTVRTVKSDQRGKIVSDRTTCFEPKKCSYFWWTYFGLSYLKKVSCK